MTKPQGNEALRNACNELLIEIRIHHVLLAVANSAGRDEVIELHQQQRVLEAMDVVHDLVK